MADPTRYNVEELNCCFNADMVPHPEGEYVLYEDYARLKSEVDRLRASSFVTAVPYEDYARLKAENERLRKAGERLANIAHKEGYGDALGEWESAKEVQP